MLTVVLMLVQRVCTRAAAFCSRLINRYQHRQQATYVFFLHYGSVHLLVLKSGTSTFCMMGKTSETDLGVVFVRVSTFEEDAAA